MADLLTSGAEPGADRPRRRRTTLLAGVLAAAVAAVLAARSGGNPGPDPAPAPRAAEPSVVLRPAPNPGRTGPPAPEPVYRLDGDPGRAPAGLRLLVGGDRPGVLDLATGRIVALPGLPLRPGDQVDVRRSGRLTVAVVVSAADPFSRAYAVPDGGRAVLLGAVRDALPMRDGTVLTVVCVAGTGGGCVLSSRTAAGGTRWSRTIPRLARLVRETPYGVLTWVYRGTTGGTVRVEDPRTGRVVRELGRTYTVLGADDEHVAYQRPSCVSECAIVLASLRDGARSTLPQVTGTAVVAEFSPDGRRLAVGFQGLNPQDPSPAVDRDGHLAVADLAAGTWQRMPGLTTGVNSVPLPVWTAADRLLVVAGRDGVNRVADWTVGAARLAVLPVRVPDTFLQPGMAVRLD